MTDQELVNYIKSELLKSVPLNQIRQTLLSQGRSENDINEAINLTVYQEQPKKSKWWIIVPVIIIAVIGVSVFFIFSEKGTIPETKKPEIIIPKEESIEPAGPIDCGTNLDCFITASQNCKPSKVTNTITTKIIGVEQTTTSFWEIKGLEENKCLFYIRTEKIDLIFPPEFSQEIVNQQKEIYKKLEGRDGTCKFNTNDLTSLLNRWKVGSFSTEDWAVAICEGTKFVQTIDIPKGDCRLQVSIMSMELMKGVSSSVTVSGFKGDADMVSWISKNPEIASVEPAKGDSTMVKTHKIGTTVIIATDNSVGSTCTVSISVKIK